MRRAIEAEFGYDLALDTALAGAGFDISAAGTAPPALAVALAAESWEEAVRAPVGLGGDTDTLACIAGAVAEARWPVPEEIADLARAGLTPDLAEVLVRFERRVSERESAASG